ncbi:DNA adenine methylase [Pseudomonas protegens]|uniref:DNA adenine methylase n=1 Tax=Pseudomonas protegens TaxID=380021 RepID=UPI0015751B37|nr:DNA adenine methylase [Pseudomonas protegens]
MGASKVFSTPLRYPGGKGKFAHFIKQIFEVNNLHDGHYAEPFAGGAGVALELMFHEYASVIHINDLDPAIFAFWQSVVHHTDEISKVINDTPVTMENWHKFKAVLANPQDCSVIDLAMATFFLNRTNRSGILKAGVIGGKDQAGKWKLDVRYNKSELIKRIELIGKYKNRIRLYNEDAFAFIGRLIPTLPSKSLTYLDPPYYVKGSGLYRNYYVHDDHEQIATALGNIDKPWIVSYDNVEEIKKIYSNYRQDEYFLSYTAQQKKKGSEVMIYGPKLITPEGGLNRKAS